MRGFARLRRLVPIRWLVPCAAVAFYVWLCAGIDQGDP